MDRLIISTLLALSLGASSSLGNLVRLDSFSCLDLLPETEITFGGGEDEDLLQLCKEATEIDVSIVNLDMFYRVTYTVKKFTPVFQDIWQDEIRTSQQEYSFSKRLWTEEKLLPSPAFSSMRLAIFDGFLVCKGGETVEVLFEWTDKQRPIQCSWNEDDGVISRVFVDVDDGRVTIFSGDHSELPLGIGSVKISPWIELEVDDYADVPVQDDQEPEKERVVVFTLESSKDIDDYGHYIYPDDKDNYAVTRSTVRKGDKTPIGFAPLRFDLPWLDQIGNNNNEDYGDFIYAHDKDSDEELIKYAWAGEPEILDDDAPEGLNEDYADNVHVGLIDDKDLDFSWGQHESNEDADGIPEPPLGYVTMEEPTTKDPFWISLWKDMSDCGQDMKRKVMLPLAKQVSKVRDGFWLMGPAVAMVLCLISLATVILIAFAAARSKNRRRRRQGLDSVIVVKKKTSAGVNDDDDDVPLIE